MASLETPVRKKPKQRSIRRKKRPKVFMGHRATTSGASPASSSTTRSEKPSPVRTVSQKKLALSTSPQSDVVSPEKSELEREMAGTRFLNCQTILEAIGDLHCPECDSLVAVHEDFGARKGLVTKMMIACTNCEFERFLSDPGSSQGTEVNYKSVLAMRMIGKGREGLATVSAIMDLPPPLTHSSFSSYNDKLLEDSFLHREKSFKAATDHLHDLEDVPHNAVIDVVVTCDATWSKRGFTALYGVVVVASWKTGQILDVEVLSKHCSVCSHQKERDENSQEFKDWWAKHKDSCFINYEGSSPAMECTGALRIWKRSITKNCLRYTNVICDGDSKTASLLNDEKPYGEDVEIIKHECVGHVQKRLTTAINNLKKTVKVDDDGKKIVWGGQGGITKKNIQTMQVYYGGAIRYNTGDLNAMMKAVWAIFRHCTSTDEAPHHEFCPPGGDDRKKNWCKYRNAKDAGEDPPPHSKPLIPLHLASYVKPVFGRLADRKLLDRCLLGATQNQNESFNSTIWLRCPKSRFSCPKSVNVAVSLAVITFNHGMKGLLPLVESSGSLCNEYLTARDRVRLKQSVKRSEEGAKRKRKASRMRRIAEEEEFIEEEGTTYEPGGF